jgi:hypothetical protein
MIRTMEKESKLAQDELYQHLSIGAWFVLGFWLGKGSFSFLTLCAILLVGSIVIPFAMGFLAALYFTLLSCVLTK